MKHSKYWDSLAPLLKELQFTAAQARDIGVPSRMLSYFCDQALLERTGRGLYRKMDAETSFNPDVEGLILTVLSVPHGVICLVSALIIYDLTDEIMRQYWIAIPNKQRSPKRKHARFIRMRNLNLGRTKMEMGGHFIPIFDKERSVLDAFRFLSEETAIKALKAYLKTTDTHKPDLPKILKYSAELRINIDPYIQALTT